ncbi:MAG: BPTI/Kunitz domain-containing protein [Bacteroidota bacterium]|nr:BPTI/Kunitz domain-containing protein [Bacteroidota bacterium]
MNECNLEGKAGPCEAYIPSYYFEKKEKKCVEFIWGGCEGVRPFETLEACEKNCHCE